MFNEFYAKDCSKKGRSVVRLKAETGARIASRPCYGYMKDPNDPKRHLIPDPDTAWVVKHIFHLCVEGFDPAQIERKLAEERIPYPTYYYYQKYGVELRGLHLDEPYAWRKSYIAKMLEDEVYLGHTVNLKTTTISYKNKKQIARPESEQLRFENTHEPLIDQQTWEIVQDMRKHKRRNIRFEEPDPFSGMVYCADCGSVMVLCRAHTMDASKNSYNCGTYKKKGKKSCTGHYIRERDLNAVVLDDIQRITYFARQNERRFAQYIGMKQGKEAAKDISRLQKKLDSMLKRREELSALFKRLYEDSVLERIPEEQYRVLSQEYLAEQKAIDEETPVLSEQLQKLKDNSANIDGFLANARQYTEIHELTPEILHTFIERIEVGERAEKYSRTAPQVIRIIYRDIGLIDELPETMRDSRDGYEEAQKEAVGA